MFTKRWVFVSLACIVVISAGLLALTYRWVNAADGSGASIVTPNTAKAGTTQNAFSFVFTAGESMNSGGVLLTVPAGWTAPQGTSGTAGYVTVTSSGVIAKVEDAMDSATGWAAGTACANGLSLDTATKHEGTGSIRCVNKNEANNDKWYKNFSAENWSGYTQIGFWIYSSASITSGNLRFGYDDSANLATPIEQLSFPSTIPANTWTYVTIPFGSTASARASIVSYGFVIRSASALDNVTVRIDNMLIGPGLPTFPGGNEVRVQFVSLNAGQTATMAYGSGGGVNGVTAPSTLGAYTFVTKTRTTDAGTFTSIATSPVITVGPGPATRFLIQDPTDGSVDAPISVTVQALDQFGNIDTSYQNDVTLVTDGHATGAGLVNIQNGVGSLPISDTVPETVHLSLSDSQSTGLIVTSTQDVIFSAGAISQFTLSHGANSIVGSRVPYVVTRKDQFGNPITTGATTVYLYSNSTGTSSAFYTLPSGGAPVTSLSIGSGTSTATFYYTDELAGTWTLTASDNATAPDGTTGVDDAVDHVWMYADAPAQFSFTGAASATAGARSQLTVSRKDRFGNAVTSTATTVYLYTDSTGPEAFYTTSTGGSAVTSVAIPSGSSEVNVWYADEHAGSWTLTVSDNATAPDGATGIADATHGLTISAAATSQFLLNNPGDMTVGTRLGYTVTRKDAYGNLVTSGSGTVYLYSDSTGLNKAFYSASSGGSPITSVTIPDTQSTVTFYYYDDLAGTWTIAASDHTPTPDGATGIADATDSVTVNAIPIAATRFLIEDPTDGTVDASIPVSVKAVDAGGTIDTSYSQDVTLHTSGSATGGGLVDIVNGVGTLSISDHVAEPVLLSLEDTASTGLNVSSTQTVVFAAGAVTRLTISGSGTATAGTRTPYTITRVDQYGNPVLDTVTTAYLYTTAGDPTASFYETGSDGVGMTSVLLSSGTSTARVWYYDEYAAAYNLTVSDNATAPDGASGIADAAVTLRVDPAATYRFTLDHPGVLVAGGRVGYTVSREDYYANPVTSGDQTVFLYTNSTGSALFYPTAISGSTMSSVTIADAQSSKNFWYGDTAPGDWNVTASDHGGSPDGSTGIVDAVDAIRVQITPIAATRFVIVDPTDVTLRSPVDVTVVAVDGVGNIDTSYQHDVTLLTTGSATGSGLIDIVNGVGTKTISDAVAETVNLSLSDTEATGLDVSSVGHVVFSEGTAPLGIVTSPASGGSLSPGYASSQIPQGFRLSGAAYPNATLRIARYSEGAEQPLVEVPIRSSDGVFSTLIPGPFDGQQTFAVTVADADGRVTPAQFVSWYPQTGVLLEKHLQIPPTMGFASAGVVEGGDVVVVGYANPVSAVALTVDGKDFPRMSTDRNGFYRFVIPSSAVSVGAHIARVQQILKDGSTGGNSLQQSFLLLSKASSLLDLNHDGKIDITDWSIFLMKWSSTDEATRRELDVNGDGKVDLTDFSIFVRSLQP